MPNIDICVVDDHQIFRKAMVRLLKTFTRIGEIWEAGNGEECLKQGKEKLERQAFSNRDLTEREEEILKLICSEKSLKEIAHLLSVSEKTIQSHKLHIHNKLGVKSTVGLVKAAYELGLIQ